MFDQPPEAAGIHALKLVRHVVRRSAGFLPNLTGRSPDSRFNEPAGLPIPSQEQWLRIDRSSTLTVAGPCWIFTSFPYSYQVAFRTSRAYHRGCLWYPGKNGKSFFRAKARKTDGKANGLQPPQCHAVASPGAGHAPPDYGEGCRGRAQAAARHIFHHRPFRKAWGHQEEHRRAVQIQAAFAHQSAGLAEAVSSSTNRSITIRSSGRALRRSRSAAKISCKPCSNCSRENLETV